MQNPLQSKFVAWIALAIVVIVIVTTFEFRQAWWDFFDLFFAFMMVFCQLVSLYIGKFNPYAAKKLQNFAFYFLILAVLAFIAEYVIYFVQYY